ncbi:endonuclease/exonuclease/phosphatase family protein [Sandaracinobacter sp. RS1-74]|uniref:endonuclease/exonuclease/phosphatase family protein n=1 Tax=Sandaracinobacteroides sayramensis TaxID=2913411 RepID=UPI001EDB75E7|nr:endonuclease/exonuclease/phosphatase family protein [Sandaracinobacteroides sayramensis]MCG2840275.1 endonuclease/exonuclease/phosphatase family protein [Sandaracinobacteroides sayramensis]
MAESGAQSVTVASYNIRKAVGADMRRRPSRILDVLDEIGADIVVVQEADRRFGTRAAAVAPAELQERGWRHVPVGMTPAAIGWHGNAILVSPRVEVESHDRLQLPVLEPRGAVLAGLRVGGRALRIVGMHLDLSGLWRRRQARAILDRLSDAGDTPTLLMGDMNEWRAAAGCLADFAATHKLVLTGPSFPARTPIARLDRIFASNELEIEDGGVHQSPLSKVASDHLPLWVRVRLG